MTERRNNSPETEKSTRAVVLFDIDNTLIYGFSIMLFARYLADNRVIQNSLLEQMNKDMKMPRSTEEEYKIFAETIVAHFYQGLKGHTLEEIEKLGQNFLSDYRIALKPYAVELIQTMENQGRMIAVSGAPKEAFLPLGSELGIQPEYLLEGEIVNGVFTGEVSVNMALGREKIKAVAEITAEDFNKQVSYAFGDHLQHDSPILDAVSSPFLILEENDPHFEKKKREALAKSYIPVTKDDIIQKVKQRIAGINSRKQT